jgi:hypothetical protein
MAGGGCSGTFLRTLAQIEPVDVGAASGTPVGTQPTARVGSMDTDALDDVAISALGIIGGGSNLGVFVFSGATMLLDSTPAPIFHWPPPAGSTGFGRSVIDAGDLDEDGIRDVAIGADNQVYLALSGSGFANLRRVQRPVGDVSVSGRFGAALGRFEANGVRGLAIGAPLDGATVAAGSSVCEGVDDTPANHDTDCTGSVAWLFSTDITADGDLLPDCLTRGAAVGARFGAAVRGLGASPANAALARVAIGAPDVPANAGGAFVVDVDAACGVTVGATLRGEPGERFGATLGQ